MREENSFVHRRQEVIDYVYSKYGKERVAGICELTSLGPRLRLQKITRILGLPFKINFLGFKELTVLKDIENRIRRNKPDFRIENIPLEDPKTFEMLSRGDNTDVFQLEGKGMSQILKEAHPDCIEDLIALYSLYHPGPMQFIPQFIAGKSDPKTIGYPDPCLREILKPTYGIIVYQEQLMEIIQAISGFNLGKADRLRRAMGKKNIDVMDKMRVDFVEGAGENGHSAKHAIYLFEMLEPFACYSFNKSHATAYTLISYRTAFCKANYPTEFMAAKSTNESHIPEEIK